MKRYIFLILAVIFSAITYRLGWVMEGQEAISAAQQVTRGFDYVQARAGMEFWKTMQSIAQIGGGIFFILFALTFLKINNKTTK